MNISAIQRRNACLFKSLFFSLFLHITRGHTCTMLMWISDKTSPIVDSRPKVLISNIKKPRLWKHPPWSKKAKKFAKWRAGREISLVSLLVFPWETFFLFYHSNPNVLFQREKVHSILHSVMTNCTLLQKRRDLCHHFYWQTGWQITWQ